MMRALNAGQTYNEQQSSREYIYHGDVLVIRSNVLHDSTLLFTPVAHSSTRFSTCEMNIRIAIGRHVDLCAWWIIQNICIWFG